MVSSNLRLPAVAAALALALAVALLVAPGAAAATRGPSDPAKVGAAASTWYFAEGSTAYGFEEYICIENPGADAATVRLTYMLPKGKGVKAGDPFVLAPYSRATVTVAQVAPSTDVSVKVEADRQVVCERSMYWGNRIEGTDSIGVTAPGTKWYLAEGCTNYGFEEYVCLQNPGTKTATVNITYNTSAGPRKRKPIEIAAGSRETVFVNNDVPPDDVSTLVSSDRPIVAERSMYWGNRRGGHDSIGTDSPSKNWFLAEGSTKWGFDTWILLQNPSGSDAKVNLTYMTEAGPVQGIPALVKAGSRLTVDPRAKLGSADFSTSVTSTTPIIVERSMYWNNGTGKAGHDTIGLKKPALNCYLAEGSTAYGFETYILIANPNNKENNVQITYMTPHGIEPLPGIDIPPNSRVTVFVNDLLPDTDVSAWIQANYPVAAERSMYWNNRGGGHDSVGFMSNP